MNPDKMNKLIDLDINQIDKTLNALGKMSDLEYARTASKVEDKKALDGVGIERITVFLKNGESILLIKPIKGMFDGWQLNLRSAGLLSLNIDEPKFKLTDIAGETFRLSLKADDFSYWTDLIDEEQAQDVARFLSIGIGTEV